MERKEKTSSPYLFLVRRARPRDSSSPARPARVQHLHQSRGDRDARRDGHDDVEDLGADGVDDRLFGINDPINIIVFAISSRAAAAAAAASEEREFIPRRGSVERGAAHGERTTRGLGEE